MTVIDLNRGQVTVASEPVAVTFVAHGFPSGHVTARPDTHAVQIDLDDLLDDPTAANLHRIIDTLDDAGITGEFLQRTCTAIIERLEPHLRDADTDTDFLAAWNRLTTIANSPGVPVTPS
jgi:hypothetical protein